MEKILELISRVIPIFLLLGLGYLIKLKRFLPSNTMDDLKKIVVNFALPSVLFTTFLSVRLDLNVLVFAILIFTLNIIALFWGKFAGKKFSKEHENFQFLLPGYEYGMLGWSLFAGAYGLQHAGAIALADLGHEFFIWFLFVPLMMNSGKKGVSIKNVILNFFKSPVIIGIVLGVLFNLLGLKEFLYTNWLTSSVISTLEFLGNLVVPLILMVIGYGINIKRESFKELGILLLTRMGFWMPIFLILSIFVIPTFFDFGDMFTHALFTLFVLPPAFIVPVFMNKSNKNEETYVHNMLTGYTLISMIIFAIYFVFSQL
ncbi:MAG TPA: AEC family transporter [Thermotogota bacterium]|nr:AEC family transporter [Thermotogota bacterium]HPJ89761.1 AEC family transporter [Thermotogota bacterium]HPR97017.1 AEC family transporter [Thermotogota bacterium]